MICILLIPLSGCFSYRKISVSNLPSPVNYKYMICYNDTRYLIDNVEVSNDTLSGKINADFYYRKDTTFKRKEVRLYISSDTTFQIFPGIITTIPLTSVQKVTRYKYNPVRTLIFTGLSGAVVFTLALRYMFTHMSLSE